MEFYDNIVGRLVKATEDANCSCENPYMGCFPCGQCPNCLANRQRLWCYRMESEATVSTYTIPVTLTFTEAMLNSGVFFSRRKGKLVPIFIESACVDGRTQTEKYYKMPWSNEYISGASLQYKDVQRFYNRLRKYYCDDENVSFKFFCKGEYGDKNFRPHFHMVVNVRCDGSKYTRQHFINNIARAWFNACIKYRGEDNPNMDRMENVGKIVKVNPIIEIEDWGEDCAKYCAKYVSKFSLMEHCPMAVAVPEFQHCSLGYGMDFLKDKVEEIRNKIDKLIGKFYQGGYVDSNGNLDVETFMSDFEQSRTFYGLTNSGVVLGFNMPSYLKRRVFQGYYLYPKDRDYDLKKFGFVEKKWQSNVKHKGMARMRDLVRYVRFNNLSQVYKYSKIWKLIPLSTLICQPHLDNSIQCYFNIDKYEETESSFQTLLCTCLGLEQIAGERRKHFKEIANRRRSGAIEKRLKKVGKFNF